MKLSRKGLAGAGVVLVAVLCFAASAAAVPRWVTGDLNTHTYLGDGSNTQAEVVNQAVNTDGLDYIANADPGGFSAKSPTGSKFLAPIPRWLTLALYSDLQVNELRGAFPAQRIIQGLDWNLPWPAGATASIGIAGPDQPAAISNFEYLFDTKDTDVSRVNEGTQAVTHTEYDALGNPVVITDVPAIPFVKQNGTELGADAHVDALAGLQWLEDNYFTQSYLVINDPSRALNWSAAQIREMNDAAPDVVIGMEGIPGHQASVARGNYGLYFKSDGSQTTDPAQADMVLTNQARTYGGVDFMLAKVGGLWDSLLGEGRHFWAFTDSAYKVYNASINSGPAGPTQVVVGKDFFDYWPGQFNKTWTKVSDFTYEGLVAGMQSGDSYVETGDLVNQLDFKVTSAKLSATMGGTLHSPKGKTLTITIRFKSPAFNNNGDRVRLDHIDVIAGNMTGHFGPSSPSYGSSTNPTTRVIGRFIRSKNMRVVHGWVTMSMVVRNPQKSMYFRLRATNLPVNRPNEIVNGNPVIDTASYLPNVHNPAFPNDPTQTLTGNTADIPWGDLWLYTNPIFVIVR